MKKLAISTRRHFRKLMSSTRRYQRQHGTRVVALAFAVLFGLTGLTFLRSSHAATVAVNGQSYMICDNPAQFLTSPYTYHALASGTVEYTVAQYQALPGYGTTLPSLPSYISTQGSSAPAAVIFAPGASTDLPSYGVGNAPELYFFEGGSYGVLSIQATSGSLFIGGSTTGYPEPQFNNNGAAAGISAQNDSYSFNNNPIVVSHLSAAATQGQTTITLSSSSIPLVQWGEVAIGGHLYQISAISGTQSAYTITIAGGLDAAVAASTAVYYGASAGGVTVSYLDIAHDDHSTTGTIYTGAGWTISHNNLHDFYDANAGDGVGVYGGDEGTIEYNCFSKMGDYAVNIFGHNNKFRMNEVTQSNYMPDPGCGCSGGGKWWGTLNADITDNAWVNNSIQDALVIWLDNGNTGTLISGNYFDKSGEAAIHSETGFNLDIENNLFQDGGWGAAGTGCGDSNCVGAVNLNSSGGFHVPNSRYDNQIIVANNQFINNWGGIDIWQSGGRSCENSGEGNPDAAYCSGGFPVTSETQSGGQYYFSHYGDTTNQGDGQVAAAATAGSTSIVTVGAQAINDQIGFANALDTSTTSTTNVTTLTGSQSINAASTAGFPTSGQLRVGTSAAWGDGGSSYTGAILSYTGTTATSFTGVKLVRGTGTLAGPIKQVQPYQVVSQTCYANDCKVTISPALTSSVSAGSDLLNSGTCQLFATAAATPTSPVAPDGVSYFDGCQWGTKNISIHDNVFSWDPTYIAAGTTVSGHVGTSCTAAHANSCGTNFQAFQEAGEPPFSDFTNGNSMLSNSITTCPSWDSACTTNPLKNINALSNAPSAPANNGEPANNILWYNNSYTGSWLWNLYWYGTCNSVPSDPTTGKSMPAGACSVSLANFQNDWQMETAAAVPSGGTTTYIPEDINQDGHVNLLDFSLLAAKYGQSGGSLGRADINTDGIVNLLDFSLLSAKYGT